MCWRSGRLCPPLRLGSRARRCVTVRVSARVGCVRLVALDGGQYVTAQVGHECHHYRRCGEQRRKNNEQEHEFAPQPQQPSPRSLIRTLLTNGRSLLLLLLVKFPTFASL